MALQELPQTNTPSLLNKEQIKRKEFLEIVEGIVNNNRNVQYGGAEDSFSTIASLWNTFLSSRGIIDSRSKEITALDVALMMDLMKTARLATNLYHLDSWIDKAGYATCGGGLINE